MTLSFHLKILLIGITAALSGRQLYLWLFTGSASSTSLLWPSLMFDLVLILLVAFWSIRLHIAHSKSLSEGQARIVACLDQKDVPAGPLPLVDIERFTIRTLEDISSVSSRQSQMEFSLQNALSKCTAETEARKEHAKKDAAGLALLSEIRRASRNAQSIQTNLSGTLRELTGEVDRLAGGIKKQSEMMRDINFGMEDMKSTIADVAENASDAATVASRSHEKAEISAESVHRSLESISNIGERVSILEISMNELTKQTESVGAILGVINEIADQTNLLALNAAIEAARAGESGKGFAVVADEVRKLAEKTMDATDKVREAVEGIQTVAKNNSQAVSRAVEQVHLSTDAGKKTEAEIEGLLNLVEESSQKVEAIAKASEEQSTTSEHIFMTIADISREASEIDSLMISSSESLAHIISVISELGSITQSIAEAEIGSVIRLDEGPLLEWSPELAVDIDILDTQHKTLVAMINELAGAMKDGTAKKKMLNILLQLKEYTATHFSEEEKLFDRYQYPKTAEHKKSHSDFVEKVLAVEDDIVSGRITISLELLEFLKDWLVSHISVMDKQYSEYLRSQGVR